MRRMRDWTLEHYIVAAVPALVVGVGIYHWMHRGDEAGKDAAVAKHSQQLNEGEHKTADASGENRKGSGRRREKRAEGEERSSHAAHDGHSEDEGAELEGNGPSKRLAGAANDAVAAGADCAPIEYRGDGPTQTKVTKGEWTVVMDQFHGAKKQLLSWLGKHRSALSDASAEAMEHQIRTLKIQRPPVSDEPDLSWRGIGAYSQSPENEPIIKLGGGFVHLATNHPSRARFEMARLVAQVWAPCELQRVSALDATWSPLLKCLNVTEAQDCGQGTYSESGWAVSTTLAAAVSPPGCQIPAFGVPEVARCVRSVPFSRTAAAESAAPGERKPAADTEHKDSEHKTEHSSKGGHS